MDGTQLGERAQARAVGRKFRGAEERGQCNLRRVEGGGLGRWVDVQRTLQKGGRLASELFDRLNGIGLTWVGTQDEPQENMG